MNYTDKKFRVIIPNYCPPDSFVDNVVFTLKKMGHEVLTLPAISNRRINSPVKKYIRDLEAKIFPTRIDERERWLIRTTDIFKPEICISLTQAISEETLYLLKKKGIYTVAWWGDTPANMKGRGLLVNGWDFIYFKDNQAVDKCKRIGLNAHLLHEAMNPYWHKPIAQQTNQKIAIAGTFYAYRQMLVSRLLKAGVDLALYGGRMPRWILPEIKKLHSGKFVVREEKSIAFGSAMGCLNSTDMSEGNSLNCRAFEIAGAGGLQILEYRPAVNDCFEPGKELLVFNTFEELLEIINKIKIDKSFAETIRSNGYKRALGEHTYEHRLNKILKDITH
jgi:spore maturation protein CgeB